MGALSGPALLDLPHRQARRLAAEDRPVYLLVNPVEYHGPHLSLHNDLHVSLGLTRALDAALGHVGPPHIGGVLDLGVDPVPGPGTRADPFRRVRGAVVDACLALADLGARRVVLMTFHGAPLHAVALQAGVAALQARGVAALNPLGVLFELLVDYDPRRFAAAVAHVPHARDAQDLLVNLPNDFHAGFFETSLALHLAPETVDPAWGLLPPCAPVRPLRSALWLAALAARMGAQTLAAELRFAAHGVGWYAVTPFPGYTGRPNLASADAGRVFAEMLAAAYAARCAAVFAGGPAPRPHLAWTRWLTFEGRLMAPRIGALAPDPLPPVAPS